MKVPSSPVQRAGDSEDLRPGGLFAGRTRYWDGYLATGLCALALLAAATWRGFRGSAGFWLATLLAAYLLMTLLEYFWHRLLFHRGRGSMRIGHALHHRSPAEPFGLPWQLPVIVLGLLAGALWPFDAAWLARLGLFASCRVVTSAMHNALHFFDWQWEPFQWFRRHHELHHRDPRCNFGITFPAWDALFGTSSSRQRG